MLTRKIIKSTAMVTFLALGIMTLGTCTTQAGNMRSSQEIVKEMGIGWNLGNTLDAHDNSIPDNSDTSKYETVWGNPVTTKDMIDEIKKSGFKTVRIPITWGQHISNDGTYTISEDWLNRVQEVVDYCISNDLYTVINVHHDSDWCIPTYSAEKEATKKLQSIWTQVAMRFKEYDDHLIFETLNEPRVIGSNEEWSGGTEEGREVVNRYNEAALESIRKTGGNNKERSVMIPTYGASTSNDAINDFKVPNDEHIIASIHAYSPHAFAMNESGTDTWGSYEDILELPTKFNFYRDSFKSKGIPVVIGEFGSINKNNTYSRAQHARYYVSCVLRRDMACIWWDNNRAENKDGSFDDTFGIFDRKNLSWHFRDIRDALIDGYTDVRGFEDNSNNDSEK